MDFKLIIDPDKNEQVVVTAHRNSQQIEEIKALAMGKPSKECISGYDPQDEEYRILKIQDVNLFYVDDGKTFASVERSRDYIVKTSLKELEEDLPSSFERINKSSIASWIPKQGILLFTLIFLAIFVTIWLTIYIITKCSTEKMNKKIAK